MVKAMVAIPPTPTNANWPSEICPDQPVRMVSDTATIAHTRTRLHRNRPENEVTKIGIAANAAKRKTNPIRLRLRTHQIDARRSGTGRDCGDSDQLPSSRRSRLRKSTTSTVAMNIIRSGRVRSSKLVAIRRSTTPTAIPAQTAAGSERMRASIETSNAGTSRSAVNAAPVSSTKPAWEKLKGPMRIAVAAAKAPPVAHTMVETRRGEVP